MERLELFSKVQRPTVREYAREDGSCGKRFEGYAIVFDSPSVVMCDWWEGKEFREYIDRGAVSQEMLDKCDVVCTAFHDREKLLARSTQGQGSMRLTVDDMGVKVEFEFDPSSPTHADVMVAVQRGDMPGMSFSFWESDSKYIDTYNKEDDMIERHIVNLESIFEVTVAANPAYPGTTATCKREWEALTQDEEELRKREEEEREARHLLALARERDIASAHRRVREMSL